MVGHLGLISLALGKLGPLLGPSGEVLCIEQTQLSSDYLYVVETSFYILNTFLPFNLIIDPLNLQLPPKSSSLLSLIHALYSREPRIRHSYSHLADQLCSMMKLEIKRNFFKRKEGNMDFGEEGEVFAKGEHNKVRNDTKK